MRFGVLVAAAVLLSGCQPRTAPASGARAVAAAEPPLAVAPQPWGLKRCEAAPLDYPDPESVMRPAHVEYASLPPDPVFAGMGIPLVTFRSAELVFHVSPDLPQALVDCTVAAADDAVVFVMKALALPRVFAGGPTRDVFVLRPDAAPDVLERLDPGYGLGHDAIEGQAFVSHPRGRKDAYAIFAWKKLRLSYLDLGRTYAHEWTHMVQDHIRGPRPSEIDTVIEGEAALLGALFQDAALPGSASLYWDYDARNLDRVRREHPELTPYELLTQPAHRWHHEITLFAYLTRALEPPALARVRLLARDERIDYETAFQRVAGRALVDPGLDAVVKDPKLAPRPALPAGPPALSIFRTEDSIAFVAPGFQPRERVTCVVSKAEGGVHRGELEADSRGVVAWSWQLQLGSRYVAREVELHGPSGACAGRFHDRAP